MRLFRFGSPGAEKPGAFDRQGLARDLSGVVGDWEAGDLDPDRLAEIELSDLHRLPLAPNDARIGPCVTGVGKFICIGLNYREQAEQSGAAIPVEPMIYMKATSAIAGPFDDLILPKGSQKTDWEVELGVVMGRTARNVSVAEALDYVAGYCVINDYSERAWQMERGGQWDKGKGCDGFGPVGPWLVTKTEIADPQRLALWLDVNGQRMQSGSTETMIFGAADCVSYVSEFMSLHPGDVISTGTPPGVGLRLKPPRFLKPGDKVRLGIEGLGEQHQTIRPWA